jgi:hypothetical protein
MVDAWYHVSNTQAPFKYVPGTIYQTHMHCLNVCLEPFEKHTSPMIYLRDFQGKAKKPNSL